MQQITITTDAECKALALKATTGEITSNQARQSIAELIHRAGISREVAAEKKAQLPSHQLFEDLASEMEDLLYSKILQDTPGGFDLERAASGSATGWARQLLRAARASMLRNIRTRTVNKVSSVDPTPGASRFIDAPVSRAHMVFHGKVTEDQDIIDLRTQTMHDATDWLKHQLRHLRDNKKLAAQAVTIMHGYGIPPLVRPRLEERRRLRALLDADPSLAHRSVKAMFLLVDGRSGEAEDLDDDLLALWCEYAHSHLDDIAHADPRVAQTLVDAILADRARPSRTVLRTFRASVRALGAGRGWGRLADEICECFTALEFEPYSAFDSTNQQFREEREIGHSISVMKSTDAFARALAHKGQRIWRNEDDLYEHLDRLIRELTDMEVNVEGLAAA